MNLTITLEDTIRLLNLRAAIFEGVEIPPAFAFECSKSGTLHVEVQPSKTNDLGVSYYLWLKQNWDSQAVIILARKKKEEKERAFWNLVVEVGNDIELSIRKQVRKLTKEQAHTIMLQIIEKKAIGSLQSFLRLDPEKYKELLDNSPEKE